MVKYKYIIMCGGNYNVWEKPRQLTKINNETLVERTIRLLRENNVVDIAISSNDAIYEQFNVPLLKHENPYVVGTDYKIHQGHWFDAFYPTNEPTCYLFGDVVFSPEAIKTIVETDTNDMEFFGSKKPFASNYIKTHEEPFALKVKNTTHLKKAIEKTKELDAQGKFWRKPLMWELWTVIKDAPLQVRRDEYTADYIAINDYTCDIDRKNDIIDITKAIGGNVMVKLQATRDFTLGEFNKIKIITRYNAEKREEGHVYNKDIFECDDEMAKYLMGSNDKKLIVAEIIEVIPDVSVVSQSPVEELKKETKTKVDTAEYNTTKRTTKKRNNKKRVEY